MRNLLIVTMLVVCLLDTIVQMVGGLMIGFSPLWWIPACLAWCLCVMRGTVEWLGKK